MPEGARRLGWFLALWCSSVLAFAGVVYLLRALLPR